MNKQNQALLRSMSNPTSEMETFSKAARDPFNDYTAPRFKGLTYQQCCELRMKNRDFYDELFSDSAFG